MTVSVIIPCKTKKDLCPELLPALKKQTQAALEIFVVTDKLCADGPAEKRDWAAKKARGQVLGFIDSDAYPDKNWLKKALAQLKNPQLAAVCGPGLTPPTDSYRQKISGLVWSSWLGAGPVGTFRNRPGKSRLVDDYPSFNLLIKKKEFNKVKGFNSLFWPGEDTKLCHDLVYKLKKQILYHPEIIVFHHRRPIFLPHLQQISRYGFQRGYFTKILPKTSLKLSYFLPLLLLIFLPILLPFYCLALFLTALKHHSLLLIPAIFLTHLVYALAFLFGLFRL
jgi:glycosyltransferase involved in cell wall biosynthesis